MTELVIFPLRPNSLSSLVSVNGIMICSAIQPKHRKAVLDLRFLSLLPPPPAFHSHSVSKSWCFYF